MIFNCPVIGNDRCVTHYEDEPYLVLLNHRKGQRVFKGLFKRGTDLILD